VCVAALLAATARDDLAEATRLLQQSRDEAAIQVASRALDRDDVAASQRAELYLVLGTARFDLRDDEGARLAFRRALQADFEVAPRPMPPKARALFDRTRAEVADERTRQVPEPSPKAVDAPGARAALTPSSEPHIRRWVGLLVIVLGLTAGSIGGDLLGASYGQRALAVASPDALRADLAYQRSLATLDAGLAVIGSGALVALVGALIAVWPSTASAPIALGASGNSVLVSGRF
jgi:hypothetical protein